MKKIPTFILVRNSLAGNSRSATIEKLTAKKPVDAITSVNALPTNKSSIIRVKSIKAGLKDSPKKTTISKSLPSRAVNSGDHTPTLSSNFTLPTKDLADNRSSLRVGVLDLGAWIGELPMLIEKLNAAQSIFTIFEILAPIPVGLLKTPEGVAQWAATRLGRELTRAQRKGLERQMIADDFFVAAEDIRKAMELDLIVGMTPALIAGISSEGIYWNHFCSESNKTIIMSTADLRDFAKKAERPFEAAVGVILVAALLVSINDNLGYHEDSGCLFDYNGSRSNFVDTVRAMHIEQSCLEKMTPEQSTAATDMLKALRRMKRK